jgi:hypothetical protein
MNIDEIKKEIIEAAKEAERPQTKYHESARIIVNIERQSYYGDEPTHRRLTKIREHFAEAVKKDNTDEA